MQISDLESRTGLDRATIRFYEKEGLITPQRQENGYRCYSEADQQTLMKVKLLRQLGMSLEKIRGLQQGSVGFQTLLDEQIGLLEQKVREGEQARAVCQEIRADGVRYEDMDAEYYLRRLGEPKSIGSVSKQRFLEPAVVREYHPVRRFLGRMLDYSMVQGLLRFLLIVVIRVRPFGNMWSIGVSFGALFLMALLNALFLHLFGTTPGKWLMGLRLEDANGGKLSVMSALAREWDVLHYGMGWGIPVWELWRLYRSYKEYAETSQMDWDKDCEYMFENWRFFKKAAAVGTAVALAGMAVVVSADVVKPRNRGELLTVEDFAENYNFYLYILNGGYEGYDVLDENGEKSPISSSAVTVYVYGQPETENAEFIYETENGYIRSVTYENRWTDIFMLEPVNQDCIVALYSILLAQDGVGMQDMIEISETLNEKLADPEGCVTFANVTVSWRIDAENCEQFGTMYVAGDNEESAVLGLWFQISLES